MQATEFNFKTIATIRSCFREKFGVPRQSLMMSEARGVIKFPALDSLKGSFDHLEGFSHVWVVYVFHKNLDRGWRPHVQTPRVTAPAGIGVFASRSPHRPNPIGLSVLKLEKIDLSPNDGVELHVSGLDILDGTPVIDIKPYLPFADSISNASSGWAWESIKKYPVSFSEVALEKLQNSLKNRHQNLQPLLIQMLELDPRPVSQRASHPIEADEAQGHPFAFRIFDFDVKWEIRNFGIYVRDFDLIS